LKKLLIGKLSLPLETVTQSLAILARKRAGKSYLARGIAEQLLAADQQVVIIDPKGDWWGIRSSRGTETGRRSIERMITEKSETELLYETLSTESLRLLRTAFALDLSDGAESKFCQGRLKIIAAILAKRARE
jgi:DNA helicase HerA-like ATPase